MIIKFCRISDFLLSRNKVWNRPFNKRLFIFVMNRCQMRSLFDTFIFRFLPWQGWRMKCVTEITKFFRAFWTVEKWIRKCIGKLESIIFLLWANSIFICWFIVFLAGFILGRSCISVKFRFFDRISTFECQTGVSLNRSEQSVPRTFRRRSTYCKIKV